MSMKPSSKEEEFFARQQFEKLKKVEEEKRKVRELHYLKCPKCGMDLIEIDYKSIKVDKCSACEGVWLDAGEMEAVAKMDKPGLDKLFNVFKK